MVPGPKRSWWKGNVRAADRPSGLSRGVKVERARFGERVKANRERAFVIGPATEGKREVRASVKQILSAEVPI